VQALVYIAVLVRLREPGFESCAAVSNVGQHFSLFIASACSVSRMDIGSGTIALTKHKQKNW